MCLAIPVRVVERLGDDAAIVDLSGIRKEISLALVDGVEVGDYVILHVGYALAKLDPEEAESTLKLFGQHLPLQGGGREGDGVRSASGNPIPTPAPPLEREGGFESLREAQR